MAAIPLPATPLSQRAEPSPLWSETSPKCPIRRGTTRIPRVGCGKAKRDCASRAPPPLGATARRTRGVLVVRATPPFERWCATGADKGGGQDGSPLPPVRGGRSHHSDPSREGPRASREAGAGDSRAEATDKQATARTLDKIDTWRTVASTCQWASKIAGFWAPKVAGSARWPTVSCRVDP